MDNATIKTEICAANDNLIRAKQAFYRGEATYDDMAAAARRVLDLRIEAERQYMGKVKTKITPRAISSLIR
jgi:hypothetical protein